ncbi:MAG: MBL fold metallo-hydrolase [bacterium]|nr:MBL fold metallo-hydrolase [bacterium]
MKKNIICLILALCMFELLEETAEYVWASQDAYPISLAPAVLDTTAPDSVWTVSNTASNTEIHVSSSAAPDAPTNIITDISPDSSTKTPAAVSPNVSNGANKYTIVSDLDFLPMGTDGLSSDGEYLGDASLLMPASQSYGQILSAVLRTGHGELIVVDGGRAEDADYLASILREQGGKVSAWLITHPHDDHAEALVEILKNPDSNISISRIYYALAEQEWYASAEPSRAEFVQKFRETMDALPAEQTCEVAFGTQISVDGVDIRVMNDLCKESNINNSSIAYRLTVNGKRILFLGDLGDEGGTHLFEQNSTGELKADVVQMSHHGQSGLTKEMYAIIKPEVCLWATPEWLWNNDAGQGVDSGPWMTLKTRRWMLNLGVKANLCTKDGDQILE